MAKRHNITVDLLIDGVPQQIYDDPSPERNTKPKESTYYVEAVTDAIIGIKVTVERGFRLMGANAVGVEVIFDGQRMDYKTLTMEDLGDPAGRYLLMDSSTVYDPQTSKWRTATFSFGDLAVLESNDVLGDPLLAGNLGKIIIEVERVNRRKIPKRARPEPLEPPHREFKTVLEVTEESLKGEAIENVIRPILTGDCEPPEPYTHRHTCIPGPQGDELQFNILYRSKRALQILGCIPKTPSPDPEPVIESDPRSDAEAGRLEQIRVLRAQLAALEQGMTVKAEPPSVAEMDTMATRPEDSSTARVKRESNGDVGFLSPKRLRRSARELIDLTDD